MFSLKVINSVEQFFNITTVSFKFYLIDRMMITVARLCNADLWYNNFIAWRHQHALGIFHSVNKAKQSF